MGRIAKVLGVAVSAGVVSAGVPPAMAQAQDDGVPLIMMRTQSTAAFGSHRFRKLVAALRKRAGKSDRQVLPLTKSEVWMVPKDKVAAVQKEASRRGVTMSQLGAAWNSLFRRVPADRKINAKQKSMVDVAKASAATIGVGMMAAPPPPMMEYALVKNFDRPAASQDAHKITVALSDSTVLTITRTGVDIRSDMCVWRGTVDGTGAAVTLMWWPGGKTAGMLQHEGKLYSIRHMGGDMHAVVEMGEDRMPREHAPAPARLRSNDQTLRDDPLVSQGDASVLRPVTAGARPPARASDEVRPQQAAADGDIVIDVIVAYTKKAASYYADARRELVDLSIEEANQSFRLSQLGHIKLRLVHAYQTDYMEEGAHFDHVWRFADKGDGHMEEIHGLRDRYKADVAVLIVDDNKGCGLATRVHADADEAFAVVHHECSASTYSLAHEVGHLIGARHDLNFDKIMTPFPYGHGYVNGRKWRDIMSYKDSCGGCPRVPVWSSPKVLIKGEPAGTPDLDNARVIAEQAARVAAFR
jgi:hypothetical protein